MGIVPTTFESLRPAEPKEQRFLQTRWRSVLSRAAYYHVILSGQILFLLLTLIMEQKPESSLSCNHSPHPPFHPYLLCAVWQLLTGHVLVPQAARDNTTPNSQTAGLNTKNHADRPIAVSLSVKNKIMLPFGPQRLTANIITADVICCFCLHHADTAAYVRRTLFVRIWSFVKSQFSFKTSAMSREEVWLETAQQKCKGFNL